MDRTSNLAQAALVLKSLPKRQAAEILAQLSPEDNKTVLDAMTRIDLYSAENLANIVNRLSKQAERWQTDPTNDEATATAKSSVVKALDTPQSDVEKLLHKSKPFEYLYELHPSIRCQILSDEHPKNIAIVLSALPPLMASETIESLDPALRISVLRRICELEEISEEEITGLSFALKLRVNRLLSSRSESTGINIAAKLLSCVQTQNQETMLEMMNVSDPDLAQKLLRTVFRIDRLITLSDDDVKVILRSVDTSCWAPAIKNASVELKSKILRNLGQRPREILEREIDQTGFVDSLIQEKSRQTIIAETMRLAREGKIELRSQSRETVAAPSIN
jgi:flagellar motor switch protein FliG